MIIASLIWLIISIWFHSFPDLPHSGLVNGGYSSLPRAGENINRIENGKMVTDVWDISADAGKPRDTFTL